MIKDLIPFTFDQFITLCGLQIFSNHLGNKFLKGYLRDPSKFFLGFAGIAKKGFNFCRPKITRFLNLLPKPLINFPERATDGPVCLAFYNNLKMNF